jgi:hypothetical protein
MVAEVYFLHSSMKSILPALALCSVLSVTAQAVPPSIATDSGNATVTVTPGREVGWVRILRGNGFRSYTSGTLADTDGDGSLRIEGTYSGSVLQLSWLVVDLQSGEFATTAARGGPITELPMPLGTILPAVTGRYTQLVLPAAVNTGAPMWVRPGVGAWMYSGTRLQSEVCGLFCMADAEKMIPLGQSPAVPSEFARGDLLLTLDFVEFMGGLVDAQLDVPPNPGKISMLSEGVDDLNEGQTRALYVIRTEGMQGTVSVRCCAVTGDAVEGLDYAFTPGEVTFGPGEVAKPVDFTLLDDHLYSEHYRSLAFTLESVSGATLGTSTYSARIWDDDRALAPVLAMGDLPATVVEGDAPWTINVPVTLTGPFRGPVAVVFDVGSTRTELTFVPGEQEKILPVNIPADDTANIDRQIHVVAQMPYGGQRVERTIRVTDDDHPRLRLGDDLTIREGELVVKVPYFVEPSTPQSFTLSWTTVDGTAKAGEDYKRISYDLIVPHSTPSGELWIDLIDDQSAEPGETFYVDVTVSGAVLPPVRTRVAVTIEDDDAPPPPLSITTTRIVEGHVQRTELIRVALTTAAPHWVRFSVWGTSNGTAVPDRDFSLPATSFQLAPGQTEVLVPVTILGDVADEEDETIEVVVLSNGLTLATAMITLVDDDTRSFVSVADTTVVETTGGTTTAVFRVEFKPPPGYAGSFHYETADGTATAGSDYSAVSGQVFFQPGDLGRDIAVPVFGDGSTEGDETFTLRLSSITGHTVYLHRDVATATIFDDDQAIARPRATIDDVFVRESNDWSEATFMVRLSDAAAEPVKVRWDTGDDSASAPSDYEPAGGVVTFAPGETTRSLVVRVAGDRIVEPTESFVVQLSHADGLVIEDGQGVCTIENDDTNVPSKRRSARH